MSGLALAVAAGCADNETGTLTVATANSAERAIVTDGYRLQRLAGNLSRPRMITRDAAGNLLIGSAAGRIYKLAPPYDRATILVEQGGYPHSVAVRGETLFIATTRALLKAPYTPDTEKIEAGDITRVASIPGGGGHRSRTVRTGPDGAVYLSLGISSNCPDEYLGEAYPFERRRGGIMRLDESAVPPGWQVVASGLRNPIGFDWHPLTRELYAASHGPDHLGFENPREVFVHASPGSFHGMPWYQVVDGALVRDNCIDTEPPAAADAVTLPVATFAARNGPMGVAFIPADFPDPAMAANALIALHGSWATLPDGRHGGDAATRRPPALVMVSFDDGQPGEVVELVSGFQDSEGNRWARPAGVLADSEGNIFFTSDAGEQGLFALVRVSP